MTNEEAIKSMRNLDDIISITESEHESVKNAISALEHNSLLIEHISNLQNENTDFFNKLVETENENTKLKAEIEQLKNQFDLYYKLYLVSIDARGILTECVEQLKSELEQSVKLPCKVGDEFYCVAYEENPRVVKVFCDGYGIIKNNLTEPEQKFVWMANIEKPSDYWKIDFSIFNEKMFKTREEAEQSLKATQP